MKRAQASTASIGRFIAASLGALAWLGVATTAFADPIAVYLRTTINWMSPFPFVPSTVSGYSSVSTDARGEISTIPFDNVNPVDGPTDLSPITYGPLWINPGETILWSLGGSLSFGDFTFPVCAYGDFAIPSEPCNNPPVIPIATLMSDAFGSFLVTGAVFAFDDTVQIGTWEISSHEFLIPGPATVSLLGLGLAGLGFSRRRKPN